MAFTLKTDPATDQLAIQPTAHLTAAGPAITPVWDGGAIAALPHMPRT